MDFVQSFGDTGVIADNAPLNTISNPAVIVMETSPTDENVARLVLNVQNLDAVALILSQP